VFLSFSGGILRDVHCDEIKQNGTYHVEGADLSAAGKQHARSPARLDA
jgi:hypothetical protein